MKATGDAKDQEKAKRGQFECKKCEERMESIGEFNNHIRQKNMEIQRNGIRVGCGVCKQKWMTIEELMICMAEEHMRFQCDICESVKENIKELNKHKWR